MFVAGNLPYSSVTPPEPFGQTGVLQYAGRLIAWLMLTAGLSAAAMAFRSANFSDGLEWKSHGQMFQIISGNGQLAIVGASRATRTGAEGGWTYRGGYGGRSITRGSWQSEIGETIGVEAALRSPYRDYDGGFWFRVKWPTIAVLFMLQPVLYVLRLVVAWIRSRRSVELV